MVAIAACSKGGSSASPTTAAATSSLLAFFPLDAYMTVGSAERLAFGVADPGGTLNTKTPAKLTFTLTNPKGGSTTAETVAHHDGLPWSYYPMSYTPTMPGDHTVTTTVDGQKVSATFSVGAKGSSPVPGPGQKMPALITPTTEHTLGVNPICTQDPPCPLHATSLDVALQRDKPVAYLVATPKFCQTGICGPVLEVLESVRASYADRVTFVHQEVYQSAAQAAEKGTSATLTKAVQDLGLTSEPVLFLVGRDGTVQHRLDAAYDKQELRACLDSILG